MEIETKERKSAELARGRVRSWASDGLLKIKISEEEVQEQSPPNHCWDWETFKKLMEEDEDIIKLRKPSAEVLLTLSDEEERLSWDHSPEQYELLPDLEDEELNIILEPTKLFENTESEESLTASTSDDEVFPDYHNPSYFNSMLKRNLEVRGPKTMKPPIELPSYPDNLISSRRALASPENPDQVNLGDKQQLGRVLPRRNPLVPETVMLGPDVQHLQNALESLDTTAEEVVREIPIDVPDEELPEVNDERSLRRSARLDYKRFHVYGEKSSKPK